LKNQIPFHKSIRVKASALFFVVFLCIIVPVNWIVFEKVKQTLEEADTKELKGEVEKLMGSIKLDPLIIPLPPNGYALKLQLTKEFLAEDVFTSPNFPSLDSYSYFSESLIWDTLKIVNFKKDLEYADGELVVSLARSTTTLNNQLANVRSYLLIANALSIIIAGILVFIASGQLINPIKKIIATASHITASNSIGRVPVPSTQDESKVLADTLNAMLTRIEQSIKNQINFFASAAHELKTPLAVMQTELSLSLNQADPPTQKILRSQLQEVQRLDRLIQDFLLISQLKSETLTIRKKPEQIEEVIYASLKKAKYLAQEKSSQVQLKIDESTDSKIYPLDFDKMETVFTNLLENAIKYSIANSIIIVIIYKEGNDLVVSIENPVSEPIENIHLLTHEFQKSLERSSGLGMGLWISNQIVKLHDGQLELKSSENKFTTKVKLHS
jgi:signal transduction histidine kinase